MVERKLFTIDPYVVDVLMPDLVRHDRAPTAYLVYLHLWAHTLGRGRKSVTASLQMVADATGVSKSGVQNALVRLRRRRLVETIRAGPTDAPTHVVLTPWRRRQG